MSSHIDLHLLLWVSLFLLFLYVLTMSSGLAVVMAEAPKEVITADRITRTWIRVFFFSHNDLCCLSASWEELCPIYNSLSVEQLPWWSWIRCTSPVLVCLSYLIHIYLIYTYSRCKRSSSSSVAYYLYLYLIYTIRWIYCFQWRALQIWFCPIATIVISALFIYVQQW